ncbi:MAG: EVE domain-containing protein [Planctomycetota bacterium]
MQYWLMKSEPAVFAIQDLERVGSEPWDGVRNYQARNFMRDQMRVGDRVLFYHSNANPSGVAGLARVASESYPDPTSWDASSPYYDPKSSPGQPRWFLVDVAFERTFPTVLPLATLRSLPDLADMPLLKRSRLSIQPVTPEHFDLICRLADAGTA